MADLRGLQDSVLKVAKMGAEKLPKPVNLKLEEAAKATGQPKEYFLIGAAVALLVLIWLMMTEFVLLTLFGTCYPLYASLKVLATGKLEDGPFWMAYWVSLSAFWWFTYFFGFILNMVPFMLYMKCGALVYLYSPWTRGVDKVVEQVFKPYVYPQAFGVAYVKKATEQESNGVATNSEIPKVMEELLKNDVK